MVLQALNRTSVGREALAEEGSGCAIAARPKPSAAALDVTKPFMVKVLLMFWRAAPSGWIYCTSVIRFEDLRGKNL
jgi:hypothetical protein